MYNNEKGIYNTFSDSRGVFAVGDLQKAEYRVSALKEHYNEAVENVFAGHVAAEGLIGLGVLLDSVLHLGHVPACFGAELVGAAGNGDDGEAGGQRIELSALLGGLDNARNKGVALVFFILIEVGVKVL